MDGNDDDDATSPSESQMTLLFKMTSAADNVNWSATITAAVSLC